MSDLLSDARKLRQRIHRLEILLEIEKGEFRHHSSIGKVAEDAERTEAIQRLLASGLIETESAPHHLRITANGRDFLKDVRAKVTGAGGELDWTRADEIDFSKL